MGRRSGLVRCCGATRIAEGSSRGFVDVLPRGVVETGLINGLLVSWWRTDGCALPVLIISDKARHPSYGEWRKTRFVVDKTSFVFLTQSCPVSVGSWTLVYSVVVRTMGPQDK